MSIGINLAARFHGQSSDSLPRQVAMGHCLCVGLVHREQSAQVCCFLVSQWWTAVTFYKSSQPRQWRINEEESEAKKGRLMVLGEEGWWNSRRRAASAWPRSAGLPTSRRKADGTAGDSSVGLARERRLTHVKEESGCDEMNVKVPKAVTPRKYLMTSKAQMLETDLQLARNMSSCQGV